MEWSEETDVAPSRSPSASRPIRRHADSYVPPANPHRSDLLKLIPATRPVALKQQTRLFGDEPPEAGGHKPGWVYTAGDESLLGKRCVAIVGTRNVTPIGAARARRLAKELAEAGVVVVSGLAKGVDTAALNGAIEAKGKVIAVIGTPLDRAYPAENKRLQEEIYRHHLLLSPFAPGAAVNKGFFPQRNKVMATLSDATVIIEASDTSGTLHQAAECTQLGRWLFIAKSVMDDASLKWPKSFANYDRTRTLASTQDLLDVLP